MDWGQIVQQNNKQNYLSILKRNPERVSETQEEVTGGPGSPGLPGGPSFPWKNTNQKNS